MDSVLPARPATSDQHEGASSASPQRRGRPPEATWFRQVLGQYPTGVSIVTATDAEGEPVGMTVGTFTSVSLDPPLVGFMPDRSSTSWPRIEAVGSFCINVLSEHQEPVCRAFAMKLSDKFDAVGWRPAGSGAPILNGALAWIDCDLEVVHEAGDHYIVLGRVRELDVETPTLPLLFFQGGYGRFTPRSMATVDVGLAAQLRVVDLARPEMERIVAALPGRCHASVLVDEEIVVTASAGEITSRTPQLVGARLPAVPGLAMLYMAYADEASVERYLAHLDSADERADYRERLRVLRGRGWSVGVRSPLHAELERRAGSGDLAPPAGRLSAEVRALLRSAPFDPPGFTLDQAADVRSLHAPVFGPDGAVALVLNSFFRSAGRHDRAEVEHALGVLLDAARAISAASGHVLPRA